MNKVVLDPCEAQPGTEELVPLIKDKLQSKYPDNVEFKEWEARGNSLRFELKKCLNDALPKLFPSELEFESTVKES